MNSIELSHEYKIIFENKKMASKVSDTMMSYLLDLVEEDDFVGCDLLQLLPTDNQDCYN